MQPLVAPPWHVVLPARAPWLVPLLLWCVVLAGLAGVRVPLPATESLVPPTERPMEGLMPDRGAELLSKSLGFLGEGMTIKAILSPR